MPILDGEYMLLNFSVKNFRSIKHEQQISMVPANIQDNAEALIFDNDIYEKTLATAVMYGPNASGKTSLIKALNAVKKIIKSSLKDKDALNQSIQPFLFDPVTPQEPTEFNAVFISNKIKYEYGFSATKTQILSEWLYHYPKGRANRLFIREFNELSKLYEYSYGADYKGERKGTQNITDKHSLYLSASQRTSALVTTKYVLDWFLKKLIIIGVDGVADLITSGLMHENELDKVEVINYLKKSGIELSDIEITGTPFNEALLPPNIPEAMKKDLIETLRDKINIETSLIHSVGKDNYKLPLDEESSGTVRLFGYAAPILEALLNERVMIVDELNSNLHANIVKSILNIFSDSKTNINRSQLFFTTHDTSILNQNNLRRDQIWLCDRNTSLATEISSVVEFKTRPLRNYENAYLSGKFNAVPIISKLDSKLKTKQIQDKISGDQ